MLFLFSISGLEDFENKIDKIAGEVDEDEDSWINKIYSKLSNNPDITGDNLDKEDNFNPELLDGLEPPILDDTWGLKDPGDSSLDHLGKMFLFMLNKRIIIT